MHRSQPSKLVTEELRVQFYFLDELDWGETLASVTVDVVVSSGLDNDPDLIKKSSAQIESDGATVYQPVRLGVPGVIYRLVCAAVTTTGRTVSIDKLLAILPDGATRPDYNTIDYTTTLYPIDVMDFLTSVAQLSDASVEQTILLDMAVEEIKSVASLINASVTFVPIYAFTEEIKSVAALMSGNVVEIVLYSFTDEMKSAASLSSGAVANIVQTSFTDEMKATASLISGSVI